MIYDFEPLKVTFYDFLYYCLNRSLSEDDPTVIPVIRAEDDDLRPSTLYVDYKLLTNAAKYGLSGEEVYNSSTGKFDVHSQNRITVSIQAYGVGAQGALQQVLNSLDLASAKAILRANNNSILNNGEVIDATQFLENDHEERAVLDMVLGLTMKVTDDDLVTIDKVVVRSGLPAGKDKTVE